MHLRLENLSLNTQEMRMFVTECTKDVQFCYWMHKRCEFLLLNAQKMENFVTEYTKDAQFCYWMHKRCEILLLNELKMQKNYFEAERSLNALQMHQKFSQHWAEMSIRANKPERDTKLNKIP